MIDKNIFRILLLIVTAATTIDGTYQGCWKENVRRRVFDRNAGAIGQGQLSQAKCMTLCGAYGYRFAALAAGKFCWCGDDEAGNTLAMAPTNATCDIPCQTGPGTCGSGDGYVDVFDALPPIKLSLAVSTAVVATGSPVTFTPTVTTTATSWNIALDFDDGAGKTAYQLSGGGSTVTRTFYQAGRYKVKAYVTDKDSISADVVSSVGVVVVTEASNLDLTCPQYMSTYEWGRCTTSVTSGTNLQLDVSYVDGTQVAKSYPLADAYESRMGNIPLFDPGAGTSVSANTGGLILLSNTPAQLLGPLKGIEFHAQTIGTFNAYIYRPSVGGGNEYCYESNSAVPTGTCAQTCGADLYCTDEQRCCASPPSSTVAPQPTYTRLHTEAITVTVSGHNYHPVSSVVEIQPGDIIAYDGTGSNIVSVLAGATSPDYFCSGFTTGQTPISTGTCSAGSESSQLGAIISSPSNGYIPIRFTAFGTTPIYASVVSREPAITGTQSTTATVTVLEGVDRCVIDMPSCVAAKESVILYLLPFTGTAASVEWDIENVVLPPSTGTTISYTFPAAGVYNVNVNISNALSFKVCSTVLHAQEPIVDFVLNVNSVLELGLTSPVVLQMTKGTDYSCSFKKTYNNDNFSPPIKSLLYADYPPGSTLDEDFTRYGTVTLEAACHNNISSATSKVVVKCAERINGLQLSPEGAWPNVEFYLLVIWATGTDVSLTVTYDGVAEPMTIDQTNRRAISQLKSPQGYDSFPVTVTASNELGSVPLSKNFVINSPLVDAAADCVFASQIANPDNDGITYITLGSAVTCDFSVQEGTSAEVSIDFGDGTAPYTHSVGQFVEFSFNPPTAQTNTYTTKAEVTLTASIGNSVNNVNKVYTMRALEDVTGITLTPLATNLVASPMCIANFTWNLSGPEPNFLTGEICWGDDFCDQFDNMDLSQGVSYIYLDSVGAMNIQYTVRNLRGSITGSTMVNCITPVLNPTLTAQTTSAALGEPYGLIYKSDTGQNGADCQLTWDCNNGDATVTIDRQGTSPDGEDIHYCTYTAGGTYNPSVRVVTLSENIPITRNTEVIVGVKSIDISSNTPKDYTASGNCDVFFDVTTTDTWPTNALLTCDYGDGTQVGPLAFTSPLVHLTHTYAAPGSYVTSITVSNDAGSVTRVIESGVYPDFGVVNFEIWRKPYLPLGAADVVGFGLAQDKFRVDEELRFKFIVDGVMSWYQISAVCPTDIFACNNSDPATASLSVTVAGTYDVYVHIYNQVFTAPVMSKTITMLEACNSISVTDNQIMTQANQPKTFNISMSCKGSDQCVAIRNGQDNVEYRYGDATICSQTIYHWSSVWTLNHDPTVDVTSSPLTLTYTYSQQKDYVLEVFAWNECSSASTTFRFSVSGIDCHRPLVEIPNSKHFSSSQDYLNYPKSRWIDVEANLAINCVNTLNNQRKWRVIRVDEADGSDIEEIDISGISSSKNAKLSLSPRYLVEGLYRLPHEVRMLATTSASFMGSAETYILVTSSDLVVMLYPDGATEISVGPSDLLELNPAALCYDPDDDEGDPTNVCDYFEMCCYSLTLGESEPVKSIRVPVPDSAGPAPTGNSGGCFNDGPGWLDDTDVISGRITINTAHFAQMNAKYQIIVTGYKGSKSNTFTGSLNVMSATPPVAKIGFIQTKIVSYGADGVMVNPPAELGLKSETDCTTCTVKWEVSVHNQNYIMAPWLGYQPIKDSPVYFEGATSKELAILPQLWERYFEQTDFKVTLSVTDQSGVTGLAVTHLNRNLAPSGGTCTITPMTGTSLSTKHDIQCNNFQDSHGIEVYTIVCNGSVPLQKVSVGRYPFWEQIYLPAGDTNNGSILHCWAEIADFQGAVAHVVIGDVVSILPATAALETLLDSFEDEADVVQAVKNLQQATNRIAALIPALEQLSNDNENQVYAGDATVLSHIPTGFDNPARVEPFKETITDPAKLKEFEERRDKGVRVVTKLVATLNDITMESTQDTKVVLETLATLSQSQAYLAKSTQTDMLKLASKGIDNLVNNEGDLSVASAESMVENVLSMCQNMKQSTTENVERPSITDIFAQEDSMREWPVSIHTEYEQVYIPPGTSAKDAEELGMRSLNKYDQKQFIGTLSSTCDNIQSKSVSILSNIKVDSNEPIRMKTNTLDAVITTGTASDLEGMTLTNEAGSFDIPDDMFEGEDQSKRYRLWTEGTPSLGVALDDSTSSPASSRSRCIKASIYDEDGNERKVSNLHKKVCMDIKFDPYTPAASDDSLLNYTNPEVIREMDYGFIQTVEVTKKNVGILAEFLFPTNATSSDALYCQLLVLVNYETTPRLGADPPAVLHSCLIPANTLDRGKNCSAETETNAYSCWIPPEKIGDKIGKWNLLVIQLEDYEVNAFNDLSSLPSTMRPSWKGIRPFCQNYKFKATEVACPYIEKGSSEMKTEGCYPQPTCSGQKVRCCCTHMTSFAGGWVVAPNAIDWDFIFSNADFLKNPTLYITMIVIIIFYILAMIWARRKDRQDLTMLGLAPLLDNDPRDKYYYEILVNTGMRRNAGTESVVHFILSGEEDETDVRTFTDKKRKVFQRGQTDGFLMGVESSLGALSYLRIWHDNSGKGKNASWYLNHVVVRNVQTDRKYYFIVNKWFAVEEDDGQVDRVIPVAGKEQMMEFSYMFSERASKNLSDGHLWFSVVARPPQSRFTRCQRVSCCLCLLFMSMLANAMFYGTENSDNTAYQFGPFALTPEQIFIGIAANILIFPVNFLIITLFRKSRPRKLRPSRVEEALKSVPERTTSMTDVNMRVKSSMSNERPGSSFLIDAKRSESSMARPESSMSAEILAQDLKKKKKKKKCQLPWWFVVVAWVLLWVTVLVSGAFVIFYGIQFQDIKCKKWITSMLVSFFTSIFFTQPIKVFLFAIIFSVIIKNPGGDEDESEEDEEPRKKLETDEELLHGEDDGYGLTAPTRPMYKPKPPDPKVLEEARKQRMKEIQMWAVIREILFYAFFLWILLVISYKSVSTNSYHYKYNMEKVFIITKNESHSFKSITNVQSYWVWAQTQMLRGLRAGPYYNSFPAFDMRGYIDDKVSRIMGYAVLRQLRIKPGSCKIPYQVDNIIDECNAPYTVTKEQDGDFGPGWSNVVNNSREEYLYRDADSLEGYPFWGEMAMYGGGGYVIRLNRDYTDMVAQFKQLEAEQWIDEYTRAVFLEFTVYNPSINMFSISSLLAEFRPSGGVFPSYRFEPTTLLPYMSAVLLFQIICEIVYMLFTCYFVFKEARAMFKQRLKYFYQFWNIMDLFICAMSVTAIVIYFYRLVCINELTEYFKATKGNGYMKFQYVGYWSEIFSYIIGFLVYFACLKFLKLLRFNKRVSLLADTLKNSAKDLIHFSIIFNIVFLAFIQVFYLIYVARIHTFKTFVSSCEAGIVMMMGKFDIYNMLEVNQWLTQIFLFLFVVTITFIVVNMFLSILNDTFGAVRNNMAQQSNDYEIVEFMMSRFKLWTGIGRGNQTTMSPEDMAKQRRQNCNTLEGQIDYFPDQIDRFLASISHMYMEKSKFDDFLHQGAVGKMAAKAQKFGGAGPSMQGMHPAPKPGSTGLGKGARGMTDVHTD